MQNLSRINEPETIVNYRRQDDVFGYDLQFLLSGVLPVLQNLSYKAQIRVVLNMNLFVSICDTISDHFNHQARTSHLFTHR